MDIVVKHDPATDEYKFYEPTTDTLLISGSIGEGFAELNTFLLSHGLIQADILGSSDIQYHIDSDTFRVMVKSNVDLIKRLQGAGTSEFKTSSDKFGGSTGNSDFARSGLLSKKGGFGRNEFGGGKSKFGKSDKKWKN